MSPRIIQMPLSGGDRKHFARHLRQVESMHASLLKKIPEAHGAANEYRALAYRYECEEWSARLFLGGDIEPSPRISHALAAGVTLLQVKCGSCRKDRDIDLQEVIWPRDKQIHTLRTKLYCTPCKAATGRNVRPTLLGLFSNEPAQPDSPKAARK